MRRTALFPLLLIIGCLAIPTGASAQYTITKISGDGQTGRPGQTLKPFVVEVHENGNPAPAGIFVTFLHNRGSLSNVPAQTDANGRAQSTLTLGRGVGVTTVTASVPGGASVTFTATAVIPTPPKPPPMNKLLIISGHDQTGLVGERLAEPFAVRVRDHDNKPLENVPVTFAVTAGGGSLSTTATATDANGRAESTLTLGTEPDTNTVDVRAEGVSKIITFSVEATLPVPVPADLAIISGDNQTGFTGEALGDPFIVEVRDQFSNPISGVSVTFAVTGGGGSLSATTATTDQDGLTGSTLTLDTATGTYTVEASVVGVSETVTFSAEATVRPPTPTTLSTVSDGDPDGVTPDMGVDPSVVEVLDQDGDPLEAVPVAFTIVGEDGSMHTTTDTTDEDGRVEFTLPSASAPGSYTVTASVDGIAGTVTFTVVVLFEFDLSLPVGLNLIHIPLKVQAINGMPGTIESVSDLYAALGGAEAVNFLITHDPVDQEWRSYFGDADRGGIGDRVLTEGAGILASTKTPVSVRLEGDALGIHGTSSITLGPGLNLVGLPLRDARLTRVSDLYMLEGIGGNVTAIIVTDNGEFKLVGRADDPGDIEITGGQAFLLIAAETATVSIVGSVWGE